MPSYDTTMRNRPNQRPIGFESLATRLERSVVGGLVAGVLAAALMMAVVVFGRSSTEAGIAIAAAGLGFGVGSVCGFAAVFMLPSHAPPQPEDDGDAEAGVPARLVPPSPVLSAKALPESNEITN